MSAFHYPITQTSEGYIFITDSQQKYLVYFDQAPIELSDNNYINQRTVYFGFTARPPLNHFERKYDSKVGHTIMKIIADFFEHMPDAILAFICSDDNDQDRNRQVVFSKWFNSYTDKDQYIFSKTTNANTYCGIIVMKKYYKESQIKSWLDNFSLEK